MNTSTQVHTANKANNKPAGKVSVDFEFLKKSLKKTEDLCCPVSARDVDINHKAFLPIVQTVWFCSMFPGHIRLCTSVHPV